MDCHCTRLITVISDLKPNHSFLKAQGKSKKFGQLTRLGTSYGSETGKIWLASGTSVRLKNGFRARNWYLGPSKVGFRARNWYFGLSKELVLGLSKELVLGLSKELVLRSVQGTGTTVCPRNWLAPGDG